MTKRASLSRTGRTSVAGKSDVNIDAFKVPSQVKDILQAEASALDMGLAEFLRELCVMRAFGPEHVRKLQAERLDAVWGKLGESEGSR